MKLVVIFATCLAAQLVSAQDFKAASLKAHNDYRAKHKNTGSMTLDNDLNSRAQKCAQYYADKGKNDHSCPHKNGAGENLYQGSGGSTDPATRVTDAAKLFYNEIKDYDYNNPGFSMKTGHFTQLVWVESTKLGVGYVKKGNSHFVTNLYLKAGNLNTREAFQKNVQPPK